MATKQNAINHQTTPWEALPKLSLNHRSMEELSTGRFIDRCQNLILKADNEALASQAAQTLCARIKEKGYSVTYLRARHLMDVLEKSGHQKVTAALNHYDLVCMDNLNLTTLAYNEIEQVLKVMEERTVSGPLIFTTPYTLPELGHLFDLFKARSTFESIVYHSILVECDLKDILRTEKARPRTSSSASHRSPERIHG